MVPATILDMIGSGDPTLTVALAAVEACRADVLVRQHAQQLVSEEAWSRVRRVLVIGTGKVSVTMARPVLETLGDRVENVVLVTAPEVGASRDETPLPRPAEVVVGDHPVPGPGSAEAARRVLRALHDFGPTADDLVLFLVSGGTSALLLHPRPPVTPDDMANITSALLASGLDVTRMNHLRAALSDVHGGRLLRHCGAAATRALVLCDNVQVGVEAVGSGLTVPDAVDLDVARDVLAQVRPHLPPLLAERVRRALDAPAPTVPSRPTVVEVAGPELAHDVALAEARATGRVVVDLGHRVQGEAREVAELLLDEIEAARRRRQGPGILVATGEVTVTVRGDGTGGRCQELAWAALPELAAVPGGALTALASDGQDFTPGVMGAYVHQSDGRAARHDRGAWTAVLDDNDCGSALGRMGRLIPSRDTGTNVCDVYVASWDA